jgi:hypothetical protein
MATATLKFGSGWLDLFHRRKPAPARVRQSALTMPPLSPRLGERRAEAMRGFFPKLSAWLAHHSYLAEMRAVDRYLSQATDIFDLERRIRCLEYQAGVFRLD